MKTNIIKLENAPSKTRNKSGGKRGNNPPRKIGENNYE
jgi:hypothetical protein